AAPIPWPSAVSGADGHFRIEHAPKEWSVLLARTGALSGRAQPTAGPLVVAVRPARDVTGTVRDTKGSPLPGARLSLMSGDAPPPAVTDAQGRHAFTSVAPGAYTLFAAREGYALSGVDDQGAFVLRATGPAGRNFTLRPLPLLTGRVEDEAHHPVAGAL